jgi:hypothetical protein
VKNFYKSIADKSIARVIHLTRMKLFLCRLFSRFMAVRARCPLMKRYAASRQAASETVLEDVASQAVRMREIA